MGEKGRAKGQRAARKPATYRNLDRFDRAPVGATYQLDGSNPLQPGYETIHAHHGKRVRVVQGPGLHRPAPAPWAYLELAEDGTFLGMFYRTVLQRKVRG